MKRSLIVMLSCAIVAGLVARAAAQPSPTPAPPSSTGTGPTSQPASPSSVGPQMQGRPIEHVQFRGNRKVEDDAIRVQVKNEIATPIVQRLEAIERSIALLGMATPPASGYVAAPQPNPFA